MWPNALKNVQDNLTHLCYPCIKPEGSIYVCQCVCVMCICTDRPFVCFFLFFFFFAVPVSEAESSRSLPAAPLAAILQPFNAFEVINEAFCQLNWTGLSSYILKMTGHFWTFWSLKSRGMCLVVEWVSLAEVKVSSWCHRKRAACRWPFCINNNCISLIVHKRTSRFVFVCVFGCGCWVARV